MNERAISAITDFIANRSEKEHRSGTDDYEILKYGVAVIYYFATKTILLIVVSLLLGILLHTLVFMAVYGGLRRFARGLHFKSNAVCTAVGFANYIIGIFLAIHLEIGLLLSIVIFMLCLMLNCIFAPSPTENTPIKKKDKLPLKIKTIVLMTALFVVMLFIGENAFRNIILIATVTETVYILPVTYKIFRERRG